MTRSGAQGTRAGRTGRTTSGRAAAISPVPSEALGVQSAGLSFAPSYQHSEVVGGLLRANLVNRRERREAERAAEKDGQTGRTTLYASESGWVQGEDACFRHLWYEFHDAPKDRLSPDTLLNFEWGDMIELRTRNILAEEGAVEKVQLHVDFSPYPVSGRLDILLRPEDRKVVEVKSATIKQRNYLPKADHITQANLYVHQVRTMPEYAAVDGAILYYVFKDPTKGQPVDMEFEIPYAALAAESALKAFEKAYTVAGGAALPDRPPKFTPSYWRCSYCPHLKTCWERPSNNEEVPF